MCIQRICDDLYKSSASIAVIFDLIYNIEFKLRMQTPLFWPTLNTMIVNDTIQSVKMF